MEFRRKVREVTGVKVVSLHHDISTATGEQMVVFTLDRFPGLREARRKAERVRPNRAGGAPAQEAGAGGRVAPPGVRPGRPGNEKPRPEGGASARQYPYRRRLC